MKLTREFLVGDLSPDAFLEHITRNAEEEGLTFFYEVIKPSEDTAGLYIFRFGLEKEEEFSFPMIVPINPKVVETDLDSVMILCCNMVVTFFGLLGFSNLL